MMRLFSKADLQALSSILALTIVLVSSPLTASVVVTAGPTHPEITANICHPIQPLALASNVLLARAAASKPEASLSDLGSVLGMAAPRLIECRVPPDTPPPKLPVQ